MKGESHAQTHTTHARVQPHDKVDDFVDATADRAKRAAHATTEQYENIKEEITDQVDNVGEYISKNPFKSALIAAGVGMLFGIMLKKK
ncbi:MAG TPA: DUF883 C-terminal domain-containing protein [Gammaproteobacteria bacterium]|nr:DUF883 C-terminal domain-containing protein [Gammaproteobacteria bacterium]